MKCIEQTKNNMKPTLQNISGIETLSVISPDPSTAVIFLHGYGANMHDLFPLWEMLHQPSFSWYFPNGVEPLPMGYYEGRSWFSIDMAKLEEAMRLGKPRDMADTVPLEFDTTMSRLETFVLGLMKELARQHQTMVVVTHEIEFARDVADRVIFMEGGRSVDQGPPDQILVDPQDPRTREFLRKVLK